MPRSSDARGGRRRLWAARLRAGTLAIAAALFAGGSARAEGVADEADLHFQLGTAAYARGDYPGALEHFFASNRLVPNRNVVFNIARTFEQLRRWADAHRSYTDALVGETDPRTVEEVEAAIRRIAPNVALLDVVTSPPGATIYLDRKDLGSRGRAPRVIALPPGKYRVLAEIEGHEPAASGEIVAALGKTAHVTLTLTRIVGTIRVTAEGPVARGAWVHLDDERSPPACAAPCEVTATPGPHQVYFVREGYRGTPRQVVVAARQVATVAAELTALTGSLLVNSDERGALITVDGRAMGFTPAVVAGVPVGRQKVRVTLRGYAPVEREVEVKAGQQAELPEVILAPVREVTAVSRYTEAVDDAPSSVSVIDGREIRAFGYPTIAESLRGIRGVYLSNDRVYYSAGIRGVGQPNDYGNRVLVLSDGQSMNDNLLNSSYIGSDGRVDLNDVDRIEVVRGPGSLLYGTGAFSGVINLVTRPRDEPNSVHLDVGTYDNAVFHTSAGFHYNLDANRGVWASASFARSDGVSVDIPLKQPPPGGPLLQTAHGADKFTSGGTAGRAWWGPFTVQWFYQKRDQSTPVGSYGTVIDDPRSGSIDTRMMVEARYEPRLTDNLELMTRVHGNRYFFDGTYLFAASGATPASTHLEDFAGSWVGGEARLVWTPFPKLRVTAGGEGQYHPEVSYRGTSYSPGMAPLRYLDVSDPYHFGAAYGIVEGTPARWLRASAGARVDVYSTVGAIFVPRAALIFHPSQDGTLKLMGGRAFRTPSIYEQDYNDANQTEAKARKLAPESVYSVEVEYSHRFLQDWVALSALHASYLENLISTQQDPRFPSGIVSYQNSPVPAGSIGAETEVRREWRQGWMVGASYAYDVARYIDPRNDSPRLVAAPEHMASIRGVAPVITDLVSLALRGTLEAPRRIDSHNDDTTPTAFVLDAAISGHVSRFGIRYTLGVYNLTGWQYALPVTENFLSRTMPQNGRTFLFDLMATYPP